MTFDDGDAGSTRPGEDAAGAAAPRRDTSDEAAPASAPADVHVTGEVPIVDPDIVELRAPRVRRRRSRGRVAAMAVLVMVLAGGLLGLGGYVWLRSQLDPGGAPGAKVELTVPSGATTRDIAGLLQDQGVVPNARVFSWWVSWKGKGPFQAGRYELRKHLAVEDAVAVLERGPLPPPVVTVSIPEGFRVAQILERIHERVPRVSVAELKAVLNRAGVTSTALPAGTHDYEGLLFPATYDVGEHADAQQILQLMASAMDDRLADPAVAPAAAALGLTPYQVVTVASLIQAEAGNPDEAPKIARVIYNRLADGEPLGIDATSRYLSIITGSPVDFSSLSPYNTRKVAGLPPTPIAAPGDFALQAALHPAVGPWRYYVLDVHKDAQGRPQHVFTDNYNDFLTAKRACHDAGLGCG